MERLTERELDVYGDACYCKCHSGDCNYECDECNILSEGANKLKAYEDAEEQGLLFRLPCKVGQELFWNIQRYNEEKNIVEYVVEKLKVIGYGGNELNPVVITAENSKKVAFRFSVSAFGKRVFLYYKEAEAALEKMNNMEV